MKQTRERKQGPMEESGKDEWRELVLKGSIYSVLGSSPVQSFHFKKKDWDWDWDWTADNSLRTGLGLQSQ